MGDLKKSKLEGKESSKFRSRGKTGQKHKLKRDKNFLQLFKPVNRFWDIQSKMELEEKNDPLKHENETGEPEAQKAI